MTVLRCLWNLIKREVNRLTAQPIYLFCMVVAPLIGMIFFLSLMKDGLPKKLPIAVVDMDDSSSSRQLTRLLDTFQDLSVAERSQSFEDARVKMQQGHIYGIFYIPEDFSKKAITGKQPKISYYTNNAFLIAGSLLFRDMKVVATMANASVALQTGLAKGYTEDQVMATIQPIVIDSHPLGNPWLNYSIYLNNALLPTILELMIILVTVFSLGTEIKMGTARQLLQMGNNSIILSLTGKLIPHTIVFTLMGFLCCSVLYGFQSFPLANGWPPMLLAMFLLVLASQAFGLFLFSLIPILRLSLSAACLLGMLAFSFSGFTFPVTEMAPAIQALTNIFPIRHYFLIYVDQALTGRPFVDSLGSYLSLLGFLVLPFFLLRNLKDALLYIKYIP